MTSDPYAVTGLPVPRVGWAVLAWQVLRALARQELLESPTAAAKLVKLLVFGAKGAGEVLFGRFAFSCTSSVSWAATGLVLCPLPEVCDGQLEMAVFSSLLSGKLLICLGGSRAIVFLEKWRSILSQESSADSP